MPSLGKTCNVVSLKTFAALSSQHLPAPRKYQAALTRSVQLFWLPTSAVEPTSSAEER